MDKRIYRLKEQILANLKTPRLVEEMADEVNLSVPQLRQLFKFALDMPIARYIREQRLEKARQLLEETFLQVNQIGYEVGLRDQSHFVRDFEAKYGVSPANYRRQHWAKFEAEMRITNKS